jgi:hypothetical protein
LAKCAPTETVDAHHATDYRRCHIDGAFKDIYVDSLTEADVAKWFAALTDNAGPAREPLHGHPARSAEQGRSVGLPG